MSQHPPDHWTPKICRVWIFHSLACVCLIEHQESFPLPFHQIWLAWFISIGEQNEVLWNNKMNKIPADVPVEERRVEWQYVNMHCAILPPNIALLMFLMIGKKKKSLSNQQPRAMPELALIRSRKKYINCHGSHDQFWHFVEFMVVSCLLPWCLWFEQGPYRWMQKVPPLHSLRLWRWCPSL